MGIRKIVAVLKNEPYDRGFHEIFKTTIFKTWLRLLILNFLLRALLTVEIFCLPGIK